MKRDFVYAGEHKRRCGWADHGHEWQKLTAGWFDFVAI